MILCKEKYVSLCLKVLGLLGTVVLTFTLHANPAVPQLRYAEQLLKQAGLGYDRWCALHHESLQAHFACKPYEQQYQQIKDTVNIVTQEYRALQQRVRELETAAAEIQAQLDRGDGENPQALREQLQEIEAQCASQREELRAIAAAQDERVQQALQISREHIKPLRREMDEAFPRVDAAEATFQQQYDEALGAYLEGLDLLGPSHARLRDNGRRQLSYIVDSKTLLQIEYSWPERLIKLEGLFARTVQQASATPRVASSSRLVRSVAPPRRSLGDLHFETFCQQSLEEVYSTRNPCGDDGIDAPALAPLLPRPPLEAMARMSLHPVEAPRQDPSTTGGFPPDTQILTQDGQWRPIDMVRAQHILPSAGDEQYAMDHPVQVVQLFSHIKPRMVQLSFVDCYEQVTAAEDQRFLVHTGHHGQTQWVQAKDLQVGSAIASRSGEPRVIASLEVVPGSRVVWNMELEHIHTYFVGQELGLVVHNAAFLIPLVTWTIGEGVALATPYVIGAAFAAGMVAKSIDKANQANGAPGSTVSAQEITDHIVAKQKAGKQTVEVSDLQEGRESNHDNGGFKGQKGHELKNAPYQKNRNKPANIGGRDYSRHALDQMQNRGLMPSVVENAIKSGSKVPGKELGTTAYYDQVNKITVLTDTQSGRVVTVGHGKIRQ